MFWQRAMKLFGKTSGIRMILMICWSRDEGSPAGGTVHNDVNLNERCLCSVLLSKVLFLMKH